MTPTPTPDLQALLARLKIYRPGECELCAKNKFATSACDFCKCTYMANQLSECETAIRGLMERMAWKPIETAPDDLWRRGWEAGRDASAMVANAHDVPEKKISRFASDEQRQSIADEQRGECIAREMIVKAIAAMRAPEPPIATMPTAPGVEMVEQTSNVLSFTKKSFTAKLFWVVTTEAIEFKISATLDGYVDFVSSFAVGPYRVHNISTDEAVILANLLIACVRDIQENCLFDRDALLTKEKNDD